MLPSTSKIAFKCSQVIGLSGRTKATSLQLPLANSASASGLRFTRFLSGSRASFSVSSQDIKNVQQMTPPPPPSEDVKVKWDLFAGVVLERKPQLTQEMVPVEKEYMELLAKYELELSKKSDHEIRKEKDKIIMEKIKLGEIDPDQASATTAQDQEDLWAAELQQFILGSRKTEADKKNDQKSLERALDAHLLLVIEQKLGSDYKWICPHGRWTEGETMRQTAERTLKELCPEIKAKVLGNAPWGVYKYKYPKQTNQSSAGAKVFFYKAQVVSGTFELSKKSDPKQDVKNYLWLKREELDSKLQPEYHKSISEFLIDEKN